jgi:ribosomal protein L27|tara:strand:+ start:327 stop:590 length:264 start_codon:yes stop_codon:yes gene_type:complete
MAQLSNQECDLVLESINIMRDMQRQLVSGDGKVDVQTFHRCEIIWKRMVKTFGGKNFVHNGPDSDYFYMTDGEVEFRKTYKTEEWAD